MRFPILELLALTPAFLSVTLANGPPASVNSDSAPIWQLESELALASQRRHHDAVLHSRPSMSRAATRAENQKHMQRLFSALRNAHTDQEERELLEEISALRRAGYRFGPEVDPGLHVPFGSHWDHTKYGPYPADRLAKGAYGKHKDAVQQEIENAYEALDRQTLHEAMEERLDPVFTDDPMMLRAAMQLHRERLAQGLAGDVERVLAPVAKIHL